MEFEKAYNRLNENQREAVDYIDGPLLVIAGPGTGKTQLLSVRVANILKQTDANPENILCLTFTDTAARNMRERLATFIGSDAYKIQIQTYHAFGSYILQDNRPELNSSIDELDRFTLIRKLQSELKPTDPLRPDYQTNNIIGTISNLKSASLTAENLIEIANQNEKDNAEIYDAICEDINQTSGLRYNKAREIYGRILDVLGTFVNQPRNFSDCPALDKVDPLAHIYYRELYDALAEEDVKEKPSTKLLGKWRDNHFKKDRYGHYVFKNNIANQRVRSLAEIMQKYQAYLDEQGLFDYDDMILNAIDLLENNDEIRFNAQERFQYILLDEFQDTNDAQAKIVALLTDNPSNEGKPNIMAVGDDDQAIYGFQGANTSNFFDFDNKYHPHHVFLTKNYRSSKPILELAHNVIEQSEDRFCKAPNVNIDKHITSENPPDETDIQLLPFQAYQSEYSFIACKIRELLDSGVSGKNISVIVPKHKYLVSILPYLHAANIPVSYTRRDNILEDPQILDVINCAKLACALATGDFKKADPFCFRALVLKHWELDNKTVINVMQEARREKQSIIETTLNSKNEKLNIFANFFIDRAKDVEMFSAEHLLADIFPVIIDSQDDLPLFSKLNTLRDTLAPKANQGNHKFSLNDFCNFVEAYNAAEIKIMDSSPYRESDNAVVLQTVHSSKGLEYDHVFLIAADNKNWSDASGNRDLMKLPQNLTHIRHVGDSLDEKIRVFFVAITRARSHLYITYSLSDFAGHSADRLKFLDLREGKDPKTNTDAFCSQVVPQPYHVEKSDLDNLIDLEPADFSPERWIDDYMPDDETKKNLLKPYVENYKLTPTGLNCFIDLKYNGPEEFLRRYIIKAPTDGSFSIDYGNIVHEVMDEMNKEKFDNEEALKHFVDKVNEADATEKDRQDLIDRGQSELKLFLNQRGDFLRSLKADSEQNFITEGIVLGDAPLTGKIDRIEIDEENKTITVADFKTSKPILKWSTDDKSLKYKTQLYFYKFLIENCSLYKNYKVTVGRIDFITPDDEGNIVGLEFKFNDKEGDTMRRLIQVVFKHIMALDFPDTTEALKASNPTKTFIEQLLSEE